MTHSDALRIFKIEDLRDLPDSVTKVLESGIDNRNEVYRQLMEANNNDFSYDWFQSIYENELSERKQKKQDFTPNSVSKITALLTGNKGAIYEPTAGNGSMIIAAWWRRSQELYPWDYRPSDHMVECWELSSRAIPLLLLNLSIRGIMGYVYHGDVLEQSIKAKYILLNRNNDALAFSETIKDANKNLKIYEI